MGRRGSFENSTQETQGDTERTPSTTNLLGSDKHGRLKKETHKLIIYLRTAIYLSWAVLVFVVVWMMGRWCQHFSFPPTLIKPRSTERHEFKLGMVQSPSLFCSEFGRHLMLNYRFEMGVEEVAAGVQLCLRYAHPHQTSFNAYESILALLQSEDICRFRENLMLRTAPKEATNWGGNWEALVNTGPTANAMAQDGLAHWFWRWTDDHWERTEYGLMIKEALEWWTLEHNAIPISSSLHKAINHKSSFLRHIRQTDYLISSTRRLVQGDLFQFPDDIYPMMPNTTAKEGKFVMRFKTSNISRLGIPDPKGVGRDFRMCKYSHLSQSTGDLIQIFMNTFKDDFKYVGEHNFSPDYLKGLLKMEESMLAKWMNWDYVDPGIFKRIKPFENKKEFKEQDAFMEARGFILAERGSESNSWKTLAGDGSGYGMWFNCTDLFDETVLPYDLKIYPLLGKVPVQRWWDSGTALISVVSHTGDSALAISSLYEEWGSGVFERHMAMNGFQKLLRQEFSRQAVLKPLQPFVLPFQPLIVAVDRSDAIFPYNMDVYGIVASGRNMLPLVEPIEILLSAIFGPWAVTDIDRAVAEGRMHMSWIRDEEYNEMATKRSLKGEGEITYGAIKLQYPNVIPATIREVVIKNVQQDLEKTQNVLRETMEFDEDDRAIGYSWSSANGIVGSSRGDKEGIPQASVVLVELPQGKVLLNPEMDRCCHVITKLLPSPSTLITSSIVYTNLQPQSHTAVVHFDLTRKESWRSQFKKVISLPSVQPQSLTYSLMGEDSIVELPKAEIIDWHSKSSLERALKLKVDESRSFGLTQWNLLTSRTLRESINAPSPLSSFSDLLSLSQSSFLTSILVLSTPFTSINETVEQIIASRVHLSAHPQNPGFFDMKESEVLILRIKMPTLVSIDNVFITTVSITLELAVLTPTQSFVP